MNKERIFYIETIEGIGFKVLFEIIENNFDKSESVNFKVNKNGIFIYISNDKLIINSSFYSKYMKTFIFNSSEEFIFGISQSDLIDFKKIKKTDILSLSIEKKSMRKIQIKIGVSVIHIKNIIDIQNYKNKIPQGYCDFPIILNNSLFGKQWKNIKTNDDKVRIQLKKKELKLSFLDTNSLIIGDSQTDEILYDDIFETNLITNIIKISSFGTLRINYVKDLLLFSAIVGCNSGYIDLYVYHSED